MSFHILLTLTPTLTLTLILTPSLTLDIKVEELRAKNTKLTERCKHETSKRMRVEQMLSYMGYDDAAEKELS
jgi:hypothetical protein